jgi:hypothetical protein
MPSEQPLARILTAQLPSRTLAGGYVIGPSCKESLVRSFNSLTPPLRLSCGRPPICLRAS